MNSDDSSGIERLCAGIAEQAREEAERILAQARADRAAALARAENEAREQAERAVSRAREEARQHRENVLSMVPVELARMRAAAIEKLLEDIRNEVLQRLNDRKSCGSPDTLAALAVDAIRQMEGTAFVIAASTEDVREFGTALRDAIAAASGSGHAIELVAENGIKTGVLVRDQTGRQRWDNRLEARLERLWPALRVQLLDALHLRPGAAP